MTTLASTKTRAERLMDERVTIQQKLESLVSEVNGRADGAFTDAEADMREQYRARCEAIDAELAGIGGDLEREKKAEEVSTAVRRHLATNGPGGEMQDDKFVYRTFTDYARDRLIRDIDRIRDSVSRQFGPQAIEDVKERLALASVSRVEHTLSSDVGGLLPPQHLTQIMAVIDTRRPVVDSGTRVALASGSLTWPQVDQRPTVAEQTVEKTELENQKMIVSMQSESARTYGGSGNLSWQAINWSTPSALDLFFRLMAEAYAQATEAVACDVLSTAATSIGSPLAGTTSDTFEDWLAAILAGIEQVLSASNSSPDTLYLSRDMFFLAAGVTSDTRQMLITPGALNLGGLSGTVAGLNVVTSRGFDSGTAIIGDSSALIVAETAGAPVELRAVEPAIGGLEVGIIGAFIAKSFDDDRFADIGPTT